ncbi:hypothetical protein BX600DRAFT_456221 [Xylariales sp. PMI_506]|nr:hypothetical protein BX600DRAFT_456221 [Xylariales sp. PMI_506]
MELQPPVANRVSARKRRAGSSEAQHICPHCGRKFKRSEHKERHVRTHTKEKPYTCQQCGQSFTRRDLLTRHHRLTSHAIQPHRPSDDDTSMPQSEAHDDMAAAVSLSGMSMHESWAQQAQPTSNVYLSSSHPPANPPQPLAQTLPQTLPQTFQQPPLPQEFLDSTQDITEYDQFRDFANFIGGVGLPAEWSPYFQTGQPGDELVDPQLREADTPNGSSTTNGGRTGSPFNCWLPSAPQGNNIDEVDGHRPPSSHSDRQPFRITEEERARLVSDLDTFNHTLDDDFILPSRHALTRYVTSYFQGFHLHMPFIHKQTWRVCDNPPELVLAIATMGAQYSFEHRNSEKLFRAGKAVLLDRLLQKIDRFGPRTKSFLTIHNFSSFGAGLKSPRIGGDSSTWEPIDTVRTLIILMGYATWEKHEKFVSEAFSLQNLLVPVLRDLGLVEGGDKTCNGESDSLHSRWLTWAHQESVRRTKLIAFTFLHTHSVAYNVYPVLRSNEIHLRLPCSTAEWKAKNAAQWQVARNNLLNEQLNYQDALSLLLRLEETTPLDPIPTPLGNYCLLHGLLQRIHIVRDLSLPIMNQTASLPSEEVNKLEKALRSWTVGWQQAPESSLDPNNENGPIPFTSSSFLALAYVRIYLNLGPYRQLETRDPVRIAKSLCRSPPVDRSNGVISALLYATHALSIPVRLGVDRVARSQAFFWSVRHSLSGFECAVLLSKWLKSLAETIDVVPPTENEERILHWVRCVVEEAVAVVDFEETEQLHGKDPGSLSLTVLIIWTHFFKSNTQWPFINLIGASLERYMFTLLPKNTEQGR